jgi:hypothetical protein
MFVVLLLLVTAVPRYNINTVLYHTDTGGNTTAHRTARWCDVRLFWFFLTQIAVVLYNRGCCLGKLLQYNIYSTVCK